MSSAKVTATDIAHYIYLWAEPKNYYSTGTEYPQELFQHFLFLLLYLLKIATARHTMGRIQELVLIFHTLYTNFNIHCYLYWR